MSACSDQQGFDPHRCDFLNPPQQLVNGAELRDEFDRRFLADAFHPRNIVGASPIRPIIFHDARWLDPEPLAAFGFPEPLVFNRIVDADVRGEKLEHVLVAGNDDDLEAGPLRLTRQGPDQIIRLIARLSEGGNVQRFDNAMNVGNLHTHAFRHRRTLRLVRLVFFMAERGTLLVEGNGETMRLVLPDNLHQRGGKPVDGVGLKALGVVQRRKSKEGAIDVGAPIDQVQGRCDWRLGDDGMMRATSRAQVGEAVC